MKDRTQLKEKLESKIKEQSRKSRSFKMTFMGDPYIILVHDDLSYTLATGIQLPTGKWLPNKEILREMPLHEVIDKLITIAQEKTISQPEVER